MHPDLKVPKKVDVEIPYDLSRMTSHCGGIDLK
jgi:hypothetical protein